MQIPLTLKVTVVGKVVCKKILRLQRLPPFPLRMTNWANCRSIGINHRHYLKNLCVEALAEIFDFVAGLVQRVPKKINEVKSDLLNSTASQGDCRWVASATNFTTPCHLFPVQIVHHYFYKDCGAHVEFAFVYVKFWAVVGIDFAAFVDFWIG